MGTTKDFSAQLLALKMRIERVKKEVDETLKEVEHLEQVSGGNRPPGSDDGSGGGPGEERP